MPAFVRQVPMAKAMHADTILAWDMNGQPIPRLPRVVSFSVVGIKATSKRSADTDATVRLTPSSVTEPLGMTNFINSPGGWSVSRDSFSLPT